MELFMLKILIFSFLIVFSNFSFADDIKTKDLANTNVNSTNISSASASATITPEQAEDLQKQIKNLKENQEKANEQLKEIEKDM